MSEYANAFRRALETEQFIVTLEYAAPDRSEPVDDLVALARYVGDEPRIQTIGITDRVVGESAHDPIDLAVQAADASGKMPLVHLSGKNHTPEGMRGRYEQMLALGLANPLVVTGDVPRVQKEFRKNADLDAVSPQGFLDSVQAVDLARQCSDRFCIAGAVTSFKYTEPTLMMQYLKLQKKIARGMDVVFNQVGYDLRKTQELVLHLRFSRQPVPAIAALYWQTPAFARFANRGEVPGVIITEDLVTLLEQWSKLPDKGKAKRVEMMMLHIGLAKLFGYAGVHIGGFKKPGTLREVLDRVDELMAGRPSVDDLWQRWLDLARLEDGRAVRLAPNDGFYLFTADSNGLNTDQPSPDGLAVARPMRFRMLRVMHDLLFTDFMEPGHTGHAVSRFVSRHPVLQKAGYVCERLAKTPLVGCEGCGSCSLPETEYVCIESTCGKGLLNGPCGGCSAEGTCEAFPGRECAWAEIYRRAKAAGELDKLASTFVPPKNRHLRKTCSWMNLALALDHHARMEQDDDPNQHSGP